MERDLDVVVIGAGFCGLAAGAALRRRGVERFEILEQGGRVGHFWTTTYDRIHLHSAFHDLPDDGGLRRRYPIFLSRADLLDYFARYAARAGLGPHLRFDARVTRVARIAAEDAARAGGLAWRVETPGGVIRTRYVVVATALNRVPKAPELPGQERFRGRVLHSSAYRNPGPFAGRRVLVVGSGNSAAEIALDLAEGAARDVAMWVRGPRHFLPLRRMGLLFRLMRLLGQLSGPRMERAHAVTWGTPAFEATIAARDRIVGRLALDLSALGIRRPEAGPFAEAFRRGRIPTFDRGTVARLRDGSIRVVDGRKLPLEELEAGGVRLGGELHRFDDVILATGFDPGLEAFIADRELLGPVRWHPCLPLTDGRARSRIHPSIFFPGFDVTPLGGQSLGLWGREVAHRIVDELPSAAR